MIIILHYSTACLEPKQAVICLNNLNLIKFAEYKVLFAVCH